MRSLKAIARSFFDKLTPEYAALLFACVVGLMMFRHGVTIDSRLDFNIDPVNAFKSLFESWQDLLYLGSDNSWMQSYIVPFGLPYYLLAFIFPGSIAQAFIYAIYLGLAFYSFVKFSVEEFNVPKYSYYLAALFYTFNMYVATTISSSYFILLIPYAILPLQLLILKKIVFEDSKIHSFLFALTFLVANGINPPILAINLIVLMFYLCGLLYRNGRLKYLHLIIKLTQTLLLTVFINAFWLLPLIGYFILLSHSGTGLTLILSEPLSMHNRISTFVNVFKTLGVWDFDIVWPGGKASYDFAHAYLSNVFLESALFLPAIVTLVSLNLSLKDKRSKWVSILLIFSLFMSVGSNEGALSQFYLWSYNHVPLFSMFRSSYKFVSVLVFCLAYLFLLGVEKAKGGIKIAITTLFIAAIVANTFPFISGLVIRNDHVISTIPTEYYLLQKYFSADTTNYRVALLPEQYFAAYTWGFTSGNVEVLWRSPLFVRQSGTLADISNELPHDFAKALVSGDELQVSDLIRQTNIKYIVQRNDYDWNFYSDISQSPDIIEKSLDRFKKIGSYGSLDLYEVPDNMFTTLIYSTNSKFTKLSPVEYLIDFQNIKEPEQLNFLQSFNKNWALYPIKVKKDEHDSILGQYLDVLTKTLFEHDVYSETHKVIFNYANSWTIDPEAIKSDYGTRYFSTSEEGIDFKLELVYKPQAYFYLGIFISVLTVFGFGLSALVKRFMRKSRVG